jgi:CRP-like cAMP-binding protein
MYLLKEWIIEITRLHDWELLILWQVKAEEILWEMALFWDTNKRMATATALVECRLIVVLWFSIKELTHKYPELLKKIQKIINDRILHNKNVR